MDAVSNVDWRDAKLAIALTANHGVYPEEFVKALNGMIKPDVYHYTQESEHIKSGSLNEQVKNAQQLGCDWILFLDVDMVHPTYTIPRLLSHNLPIISGLYHIKVEPFSPVAGWLDKKAGRSVEMPKVLGRTRCSKSN